MCIVCSFCDATFYCVCVSCVFIFASNFNCSNRFVRMHVRISRKLNFQHLILASSLFGRWTISHEQNWFNPWECEYNSIIWFSSNNVIKMCACVARLHVLPYITSLEKINFQNYFISQYLFLLWERTEKKTQNFYVYSNARDRKSSSICLNGFILHFIYRCIFSTENPSSLY